jgi:hypothetical protein
MSFDHLLKFVEFGSLAIAAAAVYITVRNNTRQLNAQIFLAYSNRVQAIRGMTANNVVNREDAAAILFLIFEFYELKRRGFVASAIWSIWDHDMSDLLCSESFQTQWREIRPRFKNHPHFLRWVDSHARAN